MTRRSFALIAVLLLGNAALEVQQAVAAEDPPVQVEVELLFVAIDRAEIEALVREGIVEADAILGLWKQGKGVLIAAPKVLTESGMDATVKGVTEYMYPTDFRVCFGGTTNVGDGVSIGMPIAEPSGFETREIGAILQVHPELDRDSGVIEVSMTPEVTKPPEWRDYGVTRCDSQGREFDVPMKQPYVHTDTIQTRVFLRSGVRVLVGGGALTRDGERLMYIFATARVVGTDGMPVAVKGGG